MFQPPLDQYPRPAVTVDCVVFGYHAQTLSVLLAQRAEAPFAGTWSLPGGFLHLHETFLQTAERVLASKANLSQLFLEQLFTFDSPARDPRGRVLSVSYFALVRPHDYEIAAGANAAEVRWFELDQLPPLAFDHDQILQTALERLRAKVRYQPIGFELLDTYFTLSDLQTLYETLLREPIDKRNFRKKLLESGLVVPTGKKITGLRNRAPELYTFDYQHYSQLLKQGISFRI